MPTPMSAPAGSADCAGFLACAGALQAADSDWPAYGGDACKNRHSPLKQIHRGNVRELAPAWSYDTHEKGDTQTQPIVVGRVMYDVHARPQDHRARCRQRQAAVELRCGHRRAPAPIAASCTGRDGAEARVFAAVDNFVYALDAASGKVIGELRQGRAHRPARESRPRPGQPVRAANYPGRRLPRPDRAGRTRRREPARLARLRARLRRAQRRAALDFPHHSATGRARLRNLAEGCLAVHRRCRTAGRA